MQKAAQIQNFGQFQGQTLDSVQFADTCHECSLRGPRHLAAAKLQARIEDYLEAQEHIMLLSETAYEPLLQKLREAQIILVYDDPSTVQMIELYEDLGQTYQEAYKIGRLRPILRTRQPSRLGRTLDLIVSWFGI